MSFPALTWFCHSFSNDFGGLVWGGSSSLKSSILSLLVTAVVPSLWTLHSTCTHSSVTDIFLPAVSWLYWSKTERRRKGIISLKLCQKEINSLECLFSFILCGYVRIVFYFSVPKAEEKSSTMTKVTRVCFSAGSFVLVLWLALKPLLLIIHHSRKHYVLLNNLLNHGFQSGHFGPWPKESDRTLPDQKLTTPASDQATSLSMQCVKGITLLAFPCLIALTCPEISTPAQRFTVP